MSTWELLWLLLAAAWVGYHIAAVIDEPRSRRSWALLSVWIVIAGFDIATAVTS